MLFSKTSYLIGLIFVLLGIVLLLNNLGLTEVSISDITSTYWPLILIYLGLSSLTEGLKREDVRSQRILPVERLTGLILLGLGLLLLGNNLELLEVDLSFFWSIFWPLLLIFFGINLLKGITGSGGTNWAIMSGIEKTKEAWRLENKNYFAIMGGVDLDLSLAQIPDGDTVLVLTAVMGGIDLKIPEEIPVECEGLAILGGVDFFEDSGGGILMNRSFSNKGEEGHKKRLILRCQTIMGGIEVTSSR